MVSYIILVREEAETIFKLSFALQVQLQSAVSGGGTIDCLG
jgi:hypothetical protein